MAQFPAGSTLSAGALTSATSKGVRLLDEQIVETDAASVTFSEIPQGFRNLWIIVSGGITGTSFRDVIAQFNGDGGDNYTNFRTARVADSTFDEQYFAPNNSALFGRLPNGSLTGSVNVIIYGYSRTDREKIMDGTFGGVGSTSSADIFVGQAINTWMSTSAITSMKIFQAIGENLLAGSIFQLYGLGVEA